MDEQEVCLNRGTLVEVDPRFALLPPQVVALVIEAISKGHVGDLNVAGFRFLLTCAGNVFRADWITPLPARQADEEERA